MNDKDWTDFALKLEGGAVVRTDDGTPIGITYRDSASLRWRSITVTHLLGVVLVWSPGFATREEAKAFLLAKHKPQVAQEDAEKFANEVIGPPVDSHVRRAYAAATNEASPQHREGARGSRDG